MSGNVWSAYRVPIGVILAFVTRVHINSTFSCSPIDIRSMLFFSSAATGTKPGTSYIQAREVRSEHIPKHFLVIPIH